MRAGVTELQSAWEDDAYAVIDVWSYRTPLSIGRHATGHREWMLVPYIIETESQYENALHMMRDDIADYERRIAEADEWEEVDPTPLSKRRLMRAQTLLGVAQLGDTVISMLGARGGRATPQAHGRTVKRKQLPAGGTFSGPRRPRDAKANPVAPPPLPLNRPIGKSVTQNQQLQMDIAEAQRMGARDIRVNQQQVDAAGRRVGTNRPDLQYTRPDGTRVYIEYDTKASTRGVPHAQRILANDPTGVIITKEVN